MIRKEIKEFDEISLPSVLYKYRDWKNNRHKTILTHQEVYLAAPNTFEDEFDCKIPIRYDLLTDDEIYSKYLTDLKKNNPTLTRQQHRKTAREWVKKGLLRNKKHIEEIESDYWNKLNKSFGVLSLTANPENLKMWEKYSNNHSGICVGFDGSKMLRDFTKFGGGGEVVYCDDLPKIHPNEEFIDSAIKNIYSKLRKWHFEEEYRTHKLNLTAINNDWRKVTIEADVFKEIILGANIEKDDYEEIIRIRDRNFPNTKILQAELVRNNIIFTVIKN